MINKAMIEIPPKFAGREPVGPLPKNDKQKKIKSQDDWSGAKGLAEDVRRYGHWMRNEVFKKNGYLYLKDNHQEISIQSVWNDFCRYLYLPRLIDKDVLKNTIEAGIKTKDFFGYASGKENEKYPGLLFGKSGTVYIDDSSIVVSRDAAQKQLDAETKTAPPSVNEKTSDWGSNTATGKNGKSSGDNRPPDNPITPVPTPKLKTRFHGSVNLTPVNASLDFSSINQEIIQHFTSKIGAEVKISVEIQVKYKKGFDDSICRTVRENSNTLGFDIAEFEDE